VRRLDSFDEELAAMDVDIDDHDDDDDDDERNQGTSPRSLDSTGTSPTSLSDDEVSNLLANHSRRRSLTFTLSPPPPPPPPPPPTNVVLRSPCTVGVWTKTPLRGSGGGGIARPIGLVQSVRRWNRFHPQSRFFMDAATTEVSHQSTAVMQRPSLDFDKMQVSKNSAL